MIAKRKHYNDRNEMEIDGIRFANPASANPCI